MRLYATNWNWTETVSAASTSPNHRQPRSFDETGNLVVNTTTAKLTLEEYDALEPDEQNGYVDEGDVYVKTITSYPGNNLFIRGERVSNFRTLKKEMLFAINFSATQELDRQLQAEKDKVASLEARIFALENN